MAWSASPLLYRPLAQDARQSVALLVRTAAPGAVGPRIQHQIAALDSSIPLQDARTVVQDMSRTLSYSRFRASLVSFFAFMALLISAVGIHGVLSQLVSQRIPEFGLRRAIGASTRSLLLLVARQGGVPVVAGLAAGVACTFAESRLLSGLLYGVRPVEPLALVLVSVAQLGAAALAMALPARRAAHVDPMVALREE
jgi:putative ABC transport system permease protein